MSTHDATPPPGDGEPTAEERRDAAALAEALDRDGLAALSADVPDIEVAALVHRVAHAESLSPDAEARVAGVLGFPAIVRSRRAASVATVVSTMAVAAAAALIFLVRPDATGPVQVSPAPALLRAQANAIGGEAEQLDALTLAMRDYRGTLHGELETRYGR